MQVMKYYCDRCEEEASKQNDLTEINLKIQSKETKELHTYPNERLFICDKCLDEIGFDRKNNSIPNPFNFIKKLLKYSQ